MQRFGQAGVGAIAAAWAVLLLLAAVATAANVAPAAEALPAQSVSGTVTDAATGEPVAGVQVALDSGAAVQTDEGGRYRIEVPVGAIRVRCLGTWKRYYVLAEGAAGGHHAVRLTVEANQHVEGVDFEVVSAPQLTGEVRLLDGSPAVDVPVYVSVWWRVESMQTRERIEVDRRRWPERALPPPPTHDAEGRWIIGRTRGDVGRTWDLRTDEQGRFTAYIRGGDGPPQRDAAVDVYALARTPDQTLGGRVDLQTTTLNPEPNIALPALPLVPTASAVVSVVDPDGQPIAHAEPGATSSPSGDAIARRSGLGQSHPHAVDAAPGAHPHPLLPGDVYPSRQANGGAAAGPMLQRAEPPRFLAGRWKESGALAVGLAVTTAWRW